MTDPKTQIVSVLFLDIVGYSKRAVSEQVAIKRAFNSHLADALTPVAADERIVLDTGDGAAVAFLHHPEDALLTSDRLAAASRLPPQAAPYKIRSGLHFGPAVVVQDVNGFGNLVGDGINDAQRVMSFAGDGEVYASRHYAEMVARISDRFAQRFVASGTIKDKHGRPHEISRVVPVGSHPAEAPTHSGKSAVNRKTALWGAVAMMAVILPGLAFLLAGSHGSPPAPNSPPAESPAAPDATSGSAMPPPRLSAEKPASANGVSSVPRLPAPAPATATARKPPPRVREAIQPSDQETAPSCPQCNCPDLLTKASLGLAISPPELRFMQARCR